MEENQELTIFQKITAFFKEHKNKAIIIGLLFVLLTVFFLIDLILNLGKINPKIIEDELSKYSAVKTENNVSYITLNSEKGYIYKIDKEGLAGVKDFIKSNPKYRDGVDLLPKNFYKNSSIVKEQKDKDEVYLTKNNIVLTNEHYVFDQKLNGIPVYGSSLMVHLKNKNEIYSITGNLIYGNQATKELLTQSEVQNIAVNKAGKDSGMPDKLNVSPFGKYIINKKLLGIDNDAINYLTYSFVISAGDSPFFSTQYFVDLETGKIVYEESKVKEALNRQVNDCGNTSSCQIVRNEGDSVSSITDVNNTYDNFGLTYDYFFNSFGRDSFNNQGAKIIGNTNYKMSSNNAYWDGNKGQMFFSPKMTTLDITAHELIHGITEHTANLVYQYQSGALNESMSDIFASNIDGNWTIGEGSALGVIRNMADPPSVRSYPDRIFSQNYYCVNGSATSSNDYGGVHRNCGVMNKAYYLMSDGGSFNGCSINGVGRDVAGSIVYKALTNYLSQSANFKALYVAVLQSCGDLYGVDSTNCLEVKKALQATEMDQQPDGEQSGAKCLGKQQMIPECAGGTGTGTTNSTTSTIPTSTSISTTTTTTEPREILKRITGVVFIDTNGNNILDPNESGYSGAELQLLGIDSRTVTTNAQGNFEMANLQPLIYQSFGILSPVRKIFGSVDLTPIDIAGINFTIPLTQSMISNPNDPDPPIVTDTKPIPTTTTTTEPGATTTIPGETTTTTESSSTASTRSTTTTTLVFYNCKVDPSCISSKQSIQFCPLICTKK